MKNLSEKEQTLQQTIAKRVAAFETDVERHIYVDLPKSAMAIDGLMKTLPLLQPEFMKVLEERYSKILYPECDIEEAMKKLQTPDNAIFDLEEIIRIQARQLGELVENIKRWFYVAIPGGTEMDQQQQELEQVLNSLEEAIGKAFENVLYFHTQRGKLYAKLTKRKLYDIAKTLVQFDLS